MTFWGHHVTYLEAFSALAVVWLMASFVLWTIVKAAGDADERKGWK